MHGSWAVSDGPSFGCRSVDRPFVPRPALPLNILLTFHVQDGDSRVFQVLLFPRATGRLLYPSVEIGPASKLTGEAAGENGEESAPSYEVDFLNQGESIYVVPDLVSTTVSLDPSSGGWLVESRRRNT